MLTVIRFIAVDATAVLTVRWSIAVVSMGMRPGVAQGIALQLLMLTVSRFIAP
jgi:hypothetical protein